MGERLSYPVHTHQIRNWKNAFLEKASVVFSEDKVVFSEDKEDKEALKRLQEEGDRLRQRIGQQSMDIDFVKKKLEETEPSVKKALVKKGKVLGTVRQCDLLSVSRGSYDYRPAGISEMDFKRMEKLDELFTENPTRGRRRLSQALKKRFSRVRLKKGFVS